MLGWTGCAPPFGMVAPASPEVGTVRSPRSCRSVKPCAAAMTGGAFGSPGTPSLSAKNAPTIATTKSPRAATLRFLPGKLRFAADPAPFGRPKAGFVSASTFAVTVGSSGARADGGVSNANLSGGVRPGAKRSRARGEERNGAKSSRIRCGGACAVDKNQALAVRRVRACSARSRRPGFFPQWVTALQLFQVHFAIPPGNDSVGHIGARAGRLSRQSFAELFCEFLAS